MVGQPRSVRPAKPAKCFTRWACEGCCGGSGGTRKKRGSETPLLLSRPSRPSSTRPSPPSFAFPRPPTRQPLPFPPRLANSKPEWEKRPEPHSLVRRRTEQLWYRSFLCVSFHVVRSGVFLWLCVVVLIFEEDITFCRGVDISRVPGPKDSSWKTRVVK